MIEFLEDGEISDQAAYLEQKSLIDSGYPEGWHIAFHRGVIAADAESLELLRSRLQESGIDPVNAFFVRAGNGPGFTWIL
jgi:hypothetical protein